jgi:hypothetical protein
MSEQHQDVAGSTTPTGGLLDPTTRAVAGLVLAVVGLMGQNLDQVGTQVLLVGGGGTGDPTRYFIASAVGALLPLAVALGLTWGPARGPVIGWPTHLARAAVVVALVGVAGAALMLVGGLTSDITGGLLPL